MLREVIAVSESFNPHLQKLIFEVVENQIRDNNPPETKATWDRLKAAGYTNLQIKKKIGGVIAEHLYNIMKDKAPMDIEKYIRDLKGLR